MDSKLKTVSSEKSIPTNFFPFKRGFHLLLIIGLAFLLLVAFLTAAAGSDTTDFSLDPDGQAFEMNWGAENELWVTDFGDPTSSAPGAIWQIATDTSAYTHYEVFVGAADAHPDEAGRVWWTNTNSNTLNSIDLGNSIGRSRPLTGTLGTPTGIDIDANNNIWITDPGQSLVERFNPSDNQLCAYDLPDNGQSLYVLAHDGYVWLADLINHRILRLDPDINVIEHWPLDTGASPFGLTVDESENFWWADVGNDHSDGVLGRLNPNLDLITIYDAPYSPFTPIMITHFNGKIWYGDAAQPFNFGWLDPSVDNGTTDVVSSITTPVTPRCTIPIPSSSIPLTITTGTSAWQSTIHLENRQPDWSSYLLKAGTAAWGIAARDSNAWLVDRGHQRVVHLKFDECRQLKLSKSGPGESPVASPDRSAGCKLNHFLPGEDIQLQGRPAAGLRVGKWTGTDNDHSTALINQLTMPDMNHEVKAFYIEGFPIYMPLIGKS
jgi:streptogramin lyase